MIISRLLVVHLVTKLIVCGNAKARMVAGDPEPDISASECISFLDLFDIGAGAPGFLTRAFFAAIPSARLSFSKARSNWLNADIMWSCNFFLTGRVLIGRTHPDVGILHVKPPEGL